MKHYHNQREWSSYSPQRKGESGKSEGKKSGRKAGQKAERLWVGDKVPVRGPGIAPVVVKGPYEKPAGGLDRK